MLLGAEPVAPGTRRLVLEATGIAVVRIGSGQPIPAAASQLPSGGAQLPATVTFGGPEASNEQLLLRFPRSWAALPIDSAFLLLSPATSADPTGADVQVQVALAGSSWASGTLTQAPPAQSPKSFALARTRPPSVLRIDVTAQLEALRGSGGGDAGRADTGRAQTGRAEHGRGDNGLLLRADGAEAGSAARGASYFTGIDGELPRLDVYFRVQ